MTIPDIPTISKILSELELADGSNLDVKEVSKLLKLKKNEKKPFLTVDSRDLLMNIVSMIDKLGFENTYIYLKSCVKDGIEDDMTIIKNSPIFQDVRHNIFIEMTKNMVIKKITQSVHTCRGCGSRNIEVNVAQTKSSDEGASEFYKCMDCGKKW
jgi:DNA-directed RNA polymerase subunit M/transcription elongation factor TFIIS